MIGRLRGAAQNAVLGVLPRMGYEVVRVSPGTILVARPALARKHWMEQDKELSRFLSANQIVGLLKMYGVTCVLDVGANRGQYAEMLRKAGYRGHIVSFEPVPAVFEQLDHAAASDPKWTALPYALGTDEGSMTMNVVPGTLSSLRPATRFGAGRYPKLATPKIVEVPVRRLDGLLDDILPAGKRRRVYLKLDTQGFDLEVFGGLGERVKDIVAMQSEVALLQIYEGMPHMCEALSVYRAAGFDVAGMYPISRQSRTARVLEYDCVLVRPTALKRR